MSDVATEVANGVVVAQRSQRRIGPRPNRRKTNQRVTNLFGDTLRTLRCAKGFTMVELGRLAGYSEGYICELEGGHKWASVEVAMDFENALSETEAELVLSLYDDLIAACKGELVRLQKERSDAAR